MKLPRVRMTEGWVRVGLGILLAGAIPACKPKPGTVASQQDSPPADHGQFEVSGPVTAGPNDLFEDVTARAGIKFVQQFCDVRMANILESNGSGVVALDYDNDGWVDLYFVNCGPLDGVTHHAPGTKREPNRLYRNKGDGTFEDATEKAGVAGYGFGIGAAAADYDNDGFTDLYVVNIGKNILYHNKGNGTFEEVTDKAGVGDKGTGIGAVFFDADNDGKLDLLVANYLTFDPNYKLYFNPDGYPGPLAYKPEFNVLYRNKGDGTFEDISERAGIRIPEHRAMSVCAFDYNQDGFQDIYVCNDATPNLLLQNDGKGHFTEVGLKAQVAFNALGEAAGSMTAAVGDCNGDLLPDILVSRLGYGSLYMNAPGHVFTDKLVASGVGQLTAQYVGWGSLFLDMENDGDLDIFIANGDAHHMVGWESLLMENRGDGNFTNAADKGGAYFSERIRARGAALLDFNNDGQMDLVVTPMADRPFLLQNRNKNGHHWLALELEGTASNRDGFGARITVAAGDKKYYSEARCPAGFLSQSDRRVHFGLGQAGKVDSLRIVWPSGKVQELKDVAVDRVLKVKEG
jgi:hypothetical protein